MTQRISGSAHYTAPASIRAVRFSGGPPPSHSIDFRPTAHASRNPFHSRAASWMRWRVALSRMFWAASGFLRAARRSAGAIVRPCR